jgi:hypothetical protein
MTWKKFLFTCARAGSTSNMGRQTSQKFSNWNGPTRNESTVHIFLLIRDMVVKDWNRQFGCETIHPTQRFPSMNLLQMPCVITWAWAFLISEVVEVVRGQNIISRRTFWQLIQHSVHSTVPVLLTKDSRNEISYDFQPPYIEHLEPNS